jgi:hypothetical protein
LSGYKGNLPLINYLFQHKIQDIEVFFFLFKKISSLLSEKSWVGKIFACLVAICFVERK